METKRYKTTTEICRDCEGFGIVHVYDSKDRQRNCDPEITNCKTCKGDGRVIVSRVTTINLIPISEAKHLNHKTQLQ